MSVFHLWLHSCQRFHTVMQFARHVNVASALYPNLRQVSSMPYMCFYDWLQNKFFQQMLGLITVFILGGLCILLCVFWMGVVLPIESTSNLEALPSNVLRKRKNLYVLRVLREIMCMRCVSFFLLSVQLGEGIALHHARAFATDLGAESSISCDFCEAESHSHILLDSWKLSARSRPEDSGPKPRFVVLNDQCSGNFMAGRRQPQQRDLRVPNRICAGIVGRRTRLGQQSSIRGSLWLCVLFFNAIVSGNLLQVLRKTNRYLIPMILFCGACAVYLLQFGRALAREGRIVFVPSIVDSCNAAPKLQDIMFWICVDLIYCRPMWKPWTSWCLLSGFTMWAEVVSQVP